MVLKEVKEKEKEYREKALNYLINEKGFILLSSDDKAALLRKGSFNAVVYANKTRFHNPWGCIYTKIDHEDIENYDFIGNEIVCKEEVKPTTKLRELREKAGMTRSQLAGKSGVSPDSIKSYEYGVRDILDASYRNLKKLADVLGVSVEELVEKQ